MEKTEKRKKPTKKELLVEKASKYEDYDKTIYNTIVKLEAFLKTKEGKTDVKTATVTKSKKPTKKELLIEKATKYEDYDKTLHNTIVKLEAFLKSKESKEHKEKVVTDDDMTKKTLSEIRKIAKTHGWMKRTGTKKELIEFIKSKAVLPSKEEKRLDVVEKTVIEEEETDMEEWPVSPDVLKTHSNTVDNLKKLLKAKGIATGLPRTRKEILDLFNKSRCSFKNFTCSEDEFCDLRNNLCRELKILRDKNNEIKKLAKGLIYIDEEKGRFYGTSDAIAKVREILLSPIIEKSVEKEISVVEEVKEKEKPVEKIKSVEKEKEEHIVPIQQEEGISPININHLLDKPSESEIRRAILHCLGLYHDIDPNDEVLLSST